RGDVMRMLSAALVVASGLAIAAADQPDGLVLPPGFHAAVVAEGLGQIRHLAVRSNGDLYLSTPQNQQGKGGGIIAVHTDVNHHADRIEHFGTVDGGTGIRWTNGRLYASSPTAVYRFTFAGDELVPTKEPEIVLDGIDPTHPGLPRTNRPLAFDTKG